MKLQKVQSFTEDGKKIGFFINGVLVSEINWRLDSFLALEDVGDWLSINISGPGRDDGWKKIFGEFGQGNNLHGSRGIRITNAEIWIGFW